LLRGSGHPGLASGVTTRGYPIDMGIHRESNDAPAGGVSGAQGAFLGAAAGDALGWPNEGHRAGATPRATAEPSFAGWRQQCGSRFQRYFEDIRPGEYSDGTQLMLCAARGRLGRGEWWQTFARCELPLWLAYERGGGRAVKAAAKAWLGGKAPWTTPKTVDAYFEAGGSGVAMRVLPHCVAGLTHADFGPVARAIMADGVTTHGHPRALVGALAYGYALWAALGPRCDAAITPGDIVLAFMDQWAPLPDVGFAWPDWRKTAGAAGDYPAAWENTVKETIQLLRTATARAAGTEIGILAELGCLGRCKGSGTGSAAAACYLAGRSLRGIGAPKAPIGIAATAPWADTDTLASMAGGLIGAMHGADSLGTWADDVQDAAYLCEVASALCRQPLDASASEPRLQHVESGDLAMFLGSLSKPGASVGCTITLPDGRRAEVLEVFAMTSGANGPKVSTTRVRTQDGQTLYLHWR
jgi:ADP-ribosylglycohydrolase